MVVVIIAGCGSSGNQPGATSTTTTSASGTSTSDTSTSDTSTSHTSTSDTLASGSPTATTASVGAPADSASSQWLGYHANQARTADLPDGPTLNAAKVAWTASLGGAVRGQPVAADGVVIAATETNRVVALDPATGRITWSRVLGPPLTNVQAVAGCGDIDPLGITSTPVIDAATKTVYVVGEVYDGHGVVHHQLQGLSLSTGAVRLSETVDPPLPAGERAATLLQRASLALGNGRVYVSYGGNAGDCGSYHGWVVAVKETGPADELSFEVASDGEGGAIWESGGAPALDAQGNVYVTTGNANPDPPQGGPDSKKYTESVVKLSPTLTPLAAFKDRIAGGDEDLATGNPVLLPGGRVFAVGKTDVGYLLTQNSLSKVAAVSGVCGSNPDGGPAFDPATNRLFIPCKQGGIQILDVAAARLGPKLNGADSAPIIIGSHVWALDHNSATLYEYATATGSLEQTVHLPGEIPIFTSPSVALGRMFIATTTGIICLH